ncbi:Crp/Fnr family transcriptional regulator [Sporosarcina sp. ACRSM]|uniref:Crp/Fnr family transcriptional regulator n=1 Tax=Sporosarcina sp. ACRSM TaxID=2918216 RepID=UPI001EF571D5|nr:Crp/Fnr family transcriptional regulator [Sporosarcina sp. ACRSM]MCG7335264.1 Crp/Fnr family transcriptional regulator [Sporosarcina sp. ACRSM]
MNREDHSNNSPWLDKLPFDWSLLLTEGELTRVQKNTHLYHVGERIDVVYIVLEGRVRLYLINEEGKEKTIAIIGENGLLGEYKMQNRNAYVTSTVTVSETKLLKVKKNHFEDLLLQHRQLAKQRIEMLSMKVELLAHSSLHLSFGNSQERIVQTFLQLASMYGEMENQKAVKISIIFTHQEIADLVGTTRVTVVNVVKNLMELGLIEKKGRYYYISDVQKLRDYH